MQSDFQTNRVAIYCRLSKDDEFKKGESASIQNQRDMLIDYCKQRNWTIADIYVDDGYTGLNIDRPDFQRMLVDIKAKKLIRSSLKTYQGLEEIICKRKVYGRIFPKNGVRYIAVNDGVDTNQDNNEIVPFKNVLNEFYSRDVSKKMKSAYYTRAKQGKFTGCLAPFGYKKDENNPHLLVIDEETSWIVEKIFNYAARGYGVQYIRTLLREEKSLPRHGGTEKRFTKCRYQMGKDYGGWRICMGLHNTHRDDTKPCLFRAYCITESQS